MHRRGKLIHTKKLSGTTERGLLLHWKRLKIHFPTCTVPYKIFIVSPSLLRMAKMLQKERGWIGGGGVRKLPLPPSQCQAYIRANCSLRETRTELYTLSVFNTHTQTERDGQEEREEGFGSFSRNLNISPLYYACLDLTKRTDLGVIHNSKTIKEQGRRENYDLDCFNITLFALVYNEVRWTETIRKRKSKLNSITVLQAVILVILWLYCPHCLDY